MCVTDVNGEDKNVEDDQYLCDCSDRSFNENTNNTVDNGSFCISDIIQCDGGNSMNSSTSSDNVSSEGSSEDEVASNSEEDEDGSSVVDEDEDEDEERAEDGEEDDSEDQTFMQIPVFMGNRPSPPRPALRTPVRHTVRRSDKLVDALSARGSLSTM